MARYSRSGPGYQRPGIGVELPSESVKETPYGGPPGPTSP